MLKIFFYSYHKHSLKEAKRKQENKNWINIDFKTEKSKLHYRLFR